MYEVFAFMSTHLQSRLCLPQQAPSSTFAHPRGYTLARHLAAHHRHPQIICIIVVLKVLLGYRYARVQGNNVKGTHIPCLVLQHWSIAFNELNESRRVL